MLSDFCAIMTFKWVHDSWWATLTRGVGFVVTTLQHYTNLLRSVRFLKSRTLKITRSATKHLVSLNCIYVLPQFSICKLKAQEKDFKIWYYAGLKRLSNHPNLFQDGWRIDSFQKMSQSWINGQLLHNEPLIEGYVTNFANIAQIFRFLQVI